LDPAQNGTTLALLLLLLVVVGQVGQARVCLLLVQTEGLLGQP
jgi:hypothetical protein